MKKPKMCQLEIKIMVSEISVDVSGQKMPNN